MKIIIIALSGPDGTGKTSCAKMLNALLQKRGITTKRVWIKHVHTFAYIIVRILEIINRKHVVRSYSGTFVVHSMARYGKLWVWIELWSILLLIFKIYIYAKFLDITKRNSTTIIADRYILDSLVHITISLILVKRVINENDIDRLMASLPFKVLRSFLVKSTLTILLDGDVDVLIKRKKDKHDPRNYLSLQRLLYKLISKKMDIPVIYIDTTNRPLYAVCSDVISQSLKRVVDYGR